MLNLTREQTIIEHRKMWNWLADQYEAGRLVQKEDYFKVFNNRDVPYQQCYCCDYVFNKEGVILVYCLNACPLEWPFSLCCSDRKSFYSKYYDNLVCAYMADNLDVKSDALYELSKIAREIANLPEKEVEYDSK